VYCPCGSGCEGTCCAEIRRWIWGEPEGWDDAYVMLGARCCCGVGKPGCAVYG
jgi:hypothetical protein